MNYLELIASILGAISVYLIVRRNVWGFPIGIAMVLLYTIVFYQAKYYGDMVLQLVYVVMQIQGWYLWMHSDKAADNKIVVLRLSRRQWLLTLVLIALGTGGGGAIMHHYTDAALPYVDAFTTTISLMAQWWMNKKYLDNWPLWIFVDVIYLYQYSYKQLYLTTALYALFLVLAVMGYREWKKHDDVSCKIT